MSIKRDKPGPGQESVWDYPRPPICESCDARVRVINNGNPLADSTRAKRVLETSHPPVYYVPPEDIDFTHLVRSAQRSWCEWKGEAQYYSLQQPGGGVVAWYYPAPTPRFADIHNYLAFYPSRVDACYVDDELVQPQAGDFYGGWITSKIIGPFKGGPGTMGW